MDNEFADDSVASNLSKESIAKLAELTREKAFYSSGGDISEAIKKLGGLVKFFDLYSDEDNSELLSGSIRIRKPKDFTIYLANHTGEMRNRFTIAHELGHYVLHYLYLRASNGENFQDNAKFARYGNNTLEKEANWFAACFLMPEKEFKDNYKDISSLIELSERFKVSHSAVYNRAKGLRLLTNLI